VNTPSCPWTDGQTRPCVSEGSGATRGGVGASRVPCSPEVVGGESRAELGLRCQDGLPPVTEGVRRCSGSSCRGSSSNDPVPKSRGKFRRTSDMQPHSSPRCFAEFERCNFSGTQLYSITGLGNKPPFCQPLAGGTRCHSSQGQYRVMARQGRELPRPFSWHRDILLIGGNRSEQTILCSATFLRTSQQVASAPSAARRAVGRSLDPLLSPGAGGRGCVGLATSRFEPKSSCPTRRLVPSHWEAAYPERH
jgi:hypothetical protein